MRAIICDACGQAFRPYVAKTEIGELGVDANGMTFVEILRDGKIKGKGKLELCPDCMEKVFNFVFDDLCAADSPFIGKMQRYADKRAKNAEHQRNVDTANKQVEDEKRYFENHIEPENTVEENDSDPE